MASAAASSSSYALPLHRLSIGDEILIYWDGDRKWYPAEITQAEGDHGCEVLYKDGEREWIQLDKVKFILKRERDGSGRDRSKRAKHDHDDGEENDDRIDTIKDILFDIEDRLPFEGVCMVNVEWWKTWHDDIMMAVVKNDIGGLMDATLSLALQLKSRITTKWWAKHNDHWKKRLKDVTTTRDAALVVKDLRDNAISWSVARKIFSEEENGNSPDTTCSSDESMGLYAVNSQRYRKLSSRSRRLLDVKMQCPRTRKCSNSLVFSKIPRGTEKVQVVSCRRSHRLKEKYIFEEKFSTKNSTEELENVGDNVVFDSINSCPNKSIREENTNRVLDKNSGSSKSGDTPPSNEEEENGNSPDTTCSSDESMGLYAVNSQRYRKLSSRSRRLLDVKMQCPRTRKCSNSLVFSKIPRGTEKVQVVSCRRSHRLKEKYIFEEKFSTKNSTEELENVGDNVVFDSINSCPNKSIREENTNRVLDKNSGSSKSGDTPPSNKDGRLEECFPGNSTAAYTYRGNNGLVCSICQSGEAMSFIVQCKNLGCFCAFHIFCLHPPLQIIEKDWPCPNCNGDSCNGQLAKDKKQIAKRIHKVVGHKKVKSDDEKNVQHQFLIKWESLSHHHDSWVPREWLYIFDPLRMHSYLKRSLTMGRSDLIDERKPEWFRIDRVIACRRKYGSDKLCEIWKISSGNQDSGDFEFLVKWMGLDYCDSTWESSCTEELLAAVSKLIQRHKRAAERVEDSFVSSGSEPRLKTPNEVYGGTLYDYQLHGLNWLLGNFKARRNVILADEMGLGKTVQVVSFVDCMKQEKVNASPVLVIVPKSILFQWEKEFRCWAKDIHVIIYQGEKQSRRCIQRHEMYSSGKNVLFDALITNYEIAILDNYILKKFKWSAIIIDEAHKIKRLDCKLAQYLKRFTSDFRLLLTGTPLQNTLLELFALLHFIDPERFSDPEAEAESYSSIKRLSHENIEKKIAEIHELLKPRMLRRMKSDVLPRSIPVKKWVEVPCALTDSQRELYINILEKNYEKLNKEIQNGRKITLNFILMELRKCCNHPYLFPGQESHLSSKEAIFLSLVSASGKLQLLNKLLPRLKERGNRVLLFSQMTKMLDILEDFLAFLNISYFRIDGSTNIAARQQQMKDFNSPGSHVSVFLISTRAGGLGIDLPTADRVIIYDPDFNPFMDLQAQSRAHRIGQTRPVMVYQLITKCSVEEKILLKSKEKLAVENLIMNPSRKPSVDELHSVLLHGARTILNRKNLKATSIHYDDKAIDTLLELDPAPGEICTPDDNGYLGSIQSFVPGDDESEGVPASPKAKEWENILGPVDADSNDKNLGRGKRQKRMVSYQCEDASDSDDIYSPGSTTSNDDVSDDSESEVPEYDEI